MNITPSTSDSRGRVLRVAESIPHLSPKNRDNLDSCNSSLQNGGFTLLEVMFAVIAFCTATFAILALVSQSLDIARRLQRPMVDAGLVAAMFSITNRIVEQPYSGNLSDLLGDDYKGYTWETVGNAPWYEVDTNKLFRLDIAIKRSGGDGAIVSQGSFLFYKPDSPPGHLDTGMGFH